MSDVRPAPTRREQQELAQMQALQQQQQQLLIQMQASPQDATIRIPSVQALRLDPQFQQLSYQEQRGLVMQQVQRRLEQTPDYQRANAFTQRRMLNLAMRNFTPVFQNPSYSQRLEAFRQGDRRERGSTFQDYTQRGLVRGSLLSRLFTNDEREEALTSSDMDKFLHATGYLGNPTSVAADLVGLGMDAAPSIVAGNFAAAGVSARLAQRALTTQRGVRSWLISRGLPAATEAAVEGAYRTALAYMTDGEKRRVGEYAQLFGTEAALDFAFSRGMQLAFEGSRSLARVFGRGYRGVQRASQELLENAQRQLPRSRGEVGQAQEAFNWMRAQRAQITRDIPLTELRLNPEAQLIESAHTADVLVRKLEDGRWAIWDETNRRNAPSVVANTIDDAYEQVGIRLTRQYGKTAGGVEQFAGRPEFDAIRIAQRRGMLDSTLGSRSVDVGRREEILNAGGVRGTFDGQNFFQSVDGSDVGIAGRVASGMDMQRAAGAAQRSGGLLNVDDYLRARGFDSYIENDHFVFLHRGRQVAATVDEAIQNTVRVAGDLTRRATARTVGEAIQTSVQSGDADGLERALRSIVSDVRVRETGIGNRMQVRAEDGVVRIQRGTAPRTIEQQEGLLRDVRRALRSAGAVDKKQLRQIDSALESARVRRTFEVPFLSKGAKDRFIDFATRKAGGRRVNAQSIEVGGELLDGSPDELAYRLLLRSYDFESAQRAVRDQLGGTLNRTDEGFSLRLGRRTFRNPSLPRLLEESGFLPTSSTNALLPRLAVLDAGSTAVEWQGDIAIGSPSRVRKVLNTLSALPTTTRAARLRNGLVQVDIPQWGISRQMVPGEVSDFVGGQFRRLDNIKENMVSKGVDVYAENGTVKFITPEGVTLTARNEDELARVMRSIPDVPEGPPLLGQDIEDTLMEISAASGLRFEPHMVPTADEAARASVRVTTQASLLTGNTEFAFEQLFRDRNLPQLQVQYRQLENSVQAATAAESAYDAVIGRLERGFGREARQRIFHLLNNTSDANMRRLGLVLGEPTRREVEVARELRTMLDRMHREFGIRADFLDNYITHVRRVWQGLSPRAKAALHSPREIIQRAYPNEQPPRELSFWADNVRREHFVDYLVDDDAFSSLRKYVKRGSFVANTRRSYSAFRDAVARHSEQLGVSGVKRVNHYLDELAGGSVTKGEQFFNNIVGDFMEAIATRPRRMDRVLQREAVRLGGPLSDIDRARVYAQASAAGTRAGQNFMNNVYSMTYFANLGFKPFMAVRNSMQVWTTLAGRFSNGEVLDAIRFVNDNPEQVSDALRRIGVIGDRPPVVEDMTFGGRLQQLNERALRSFANSDHYTRAVSYVTATRALNDAVNGGFIDQGAEAFAKKAGTEFLNEADRELIYQLTKTGDVESARRLFGSLTTERTMFGYRPSQSPMFFRQSMIGKIAGRFGTYSAGYRANILSAIQHATPSGRVKFLTVFLQNSAALSGMFAAAGVRYHDFIPGMPALFSGGPTFDLAIDLFQSFDTGYTGQQARGELRRRLNPTSIGQARQIRNALDHLDGGDMLSAFAALGGVPLLD